MTLRSSINNKLKKLEKNFSVYNNIYISRSAILNNFDQLQKISGNKNIIPVLKSNAYGHGLEQIATILKDRNFPYIAVDGYFESLKIHEISKQPVLVMGAIKSENYKNIQPKNNAFVVHDLDTLKAVGNSRKKFKIHLEIETGMNRHGVKINDLKKLLNEFKKYQNLTLDGVMTHLADADNPDSVDYLNKQTRLFDESIDKIINFGFSPKYFHIAQSAGSIKVKSKYANTIRAGIALYGITPLEDNDPYFYLHKKLQPALKLTSSISKILDIKKGETVSYGRTWTAKSDCKIGILPLGYYEGLPRSLSNKGFVKFKNQYLPIIGRVCMNHTMIDLSNTKIKTDNEVLIINTDKDDALSVNNICKSNEIFNYNFLVNLNQNIRRTIIK